MPGPFEAAGTTKDPTKYGALGQGGRELTGMWTQRSPFRDAAVPYLASKFYAAGRFDSELDGINREISAALTDRRRPGNPAFGSSETYGAAQNFYSFKSIGALTGTEVVQLMADTPTVVQDITGGLNYPFLTKTPGAGKTRFLGVGTTLYMTDGPDQKKLLSPGPWVALTKVAPGTLINNIGYNENGQTVLMALGGITMTVVATSSDGTTTTVYIDPTDVPLNFPNLQGANVSFAGLTGPGAYLNGFTYAIAKIVSTTLGIFTVTVTTGAYAQAADTGTGTTGNGTTGASQPSWTSTQFAIFQDAGQQWKCYGPSLQNWGLLVPVNAPALAPLNGTRFWQPSTTIPAGFAILDSNQDVEIATAGKTGINYPTWTTLIQNAEAGVVSASQNLNLAASRPFYQTANPDTTPPTAGFVFQNTSGVAMIVVVSADGGGGGFHGVVYCDSTALPTTAGPQFSRVNAGSSSPNFYPGAVTFLVPPGFYYGISVTSGGGSPSTARNWSEYLLNGASSSVGSGSSGASGGPTVTQDGGVSWTNYGKPGTWFPTTAFAGPWNVTAPVGVILDPNGNWQYVTAGAGGLSGSTAPTWATTIGLTTTDGALTWTCLGPGNILTTDTVEYGFSTKAVDGSVSTSSPAATIKGPIVGPKIVVGQTFVQLTGSWVQDKQLSVIRIWRTAQGKPTLILEDDIPIDSFYAGSSFTYDELAIPDSSINGGASLNALIAAPIDGANNSPLAGQTGPVYHLGRMWMFNKNVVYYSGGPDTLVGNGNTAWAEINQVVYSGEVIKIRPITVQNGGMLVYTTTGMQLILGTGTPTNPFYSTVYCSTIILGNYDAEDVLGTIIYMMESNGVVSSVTIEYPFNPQSGYLEVGFPIGDQFEFVTTGGVNAALFNPKTTYLTWNRNRSADTAMYVSDGATGWFRLSMANAPESGFIWSPLAQIVGGTNAVQSVETSPGVFNLLIGSSGSGLVYLPVLVRDTTGTVWTDGLGASPYPSWDAKGVTRLCSTGEVAQVAWISTKSTAVGSRPQISVLMNEIKPSQSNPWMPLQPTSQDPAILPRTQTYYSDRYQTEQNANSNLGDCALIKFDYGSQAFGDELLDFEIYGDKHEERHQ